MADIQITCITKPGGNNSHEAITHVGSNGQKWTREQVVSWITAREHSFHTQVNGRRAEVGVYKEVYLRTHADGTWNDNLLALSPCG